MLDILLDGTITRADYLEKKKELEKKILSLTQEIKELESKHEESKKRKSFRLDLDLLFETLEKYADYNE